MVDQGLRARVERILRGDFRNDDLTRLFLFARDRCDGRESVQEIGDFVAHHHERTKGIVTRTTRDWFAMIRFKIDDGRIREKIDWKNLPSTFPDFLFAMSRHLSHQIIRRDAGISQSDTRTLVPQIVKKLDKKSDGSFSITNRHTPKEIELMSCLMNYIVTLSAFSGERLFDDFSATLKSHAILHKSELPEFEKFKPLLLLFAVSVMHGCKVVLDDGTAVQLDSQKSQDISVYASVPISQEPNSVSIASPIFYTGLDASTHCETELLEAARWDFEIEVTKNMKLGSLR